MWLLENSIAYVTHVVFHWVAGLEHEVSLALLYQLIVVPAVPLARACPFGYCLKGNNRLFGEGNGTPLQDSCLENPVWWAAVHGVAKSQTRLSDFTFTFHFHALEKEMATHFSVLAWRIPDTGEPGGLPSQGSQRVGHDWSNLAVAAATACFTHLCAFDQASAWSCALWFC